MSKVSRMAEFSALYAKARAAGLAAAGASVPTPMVVSETGGSGRSWYVSEGACGFAWVTVRPGNSPFANYLKKAGLGSPAYGGGTQIWVSEFNQSVARKEAYANAFAEVLREAGLKAYAGSRLD